MSISYLRTLVRRAAGVSGLICAAANPPSIAARHELPPPPPTRVQVVIDTINGVAVPDPYRWLEDQNSAETRTWIDAQNRYTKAALSNIPGKDRLRRRLARLLNVDVVSTPTLRNGRYFFTRRIAGKNQPAIYVRSGVAGKDETLLDPNALGDEQVSYTMQDISHDGKLVAYSTQRGGEDESTLSLMNVDTRKELADHLPKAQYGSVALSADGKSFYYTVYSADSGPRLFLHRIGAAPATDEKIFGDGLSSTNQMAIDLSADGRYLTIMVFLNAAASRSDIYVQDLAKRGAPVSIVKDIDAGFYGAAADGHLFLVSTLNAPNRNVLSIDLSNPARDAWRVIVPESKSNISGMSLAGGKVIVTYLENVSSRLGVFDASGRHVRDIHFPGIGSASAVSGAWDSDEMFYTFESFAIPPTIYRYRLSSGAQQAWAHIGTAAMAGQLDVKQIWFASKDGTRVPMFVVARKGIKLDGTNPTLLSAYGGFNVSLTPHFSRLAAAWVESGGVFVSANLRGGGEFGEKWHLAGSMANKQNSFDDFYAAAEWLIKHGYTSSAKLSIVGSSNGGLLVGAALTQRPDLFRAVVCLNPLLDMIRYPSFLSGRLWTAEYGSPDDPAQFKTLAAYSPYHHVVKGTNYPAVLFVTGDADTRVAPLHARKMTALLQAASGSGRPVLLRYDTQGGGGHAGGQAVDSVIESVTDELGFLFWQLGATIQ